tara:strand:- start:788 stop:1180 length:393 start_codon:yes stop_codon:yes gene_type:complete
MQKEINVSQDYVSCINGKTCVGKHFLIDLYGARHLENESLLDNLLRKIIVAANATLLHIHLHKFGAEQGVTGVAVLAESHISIHTWPEREYAAFDIFMCGKSQPESAIPIIEKYLLPQRMEVVEKLRGDL